MGDIIAFTPEHVAQLTGLSSRQLRYWDKTDFFAPALVDDREHRAIGRIYSFRDVVALRTISILRNQHRIPLQELRRVGAWLSQQHESPWSSLQFGLVGRKVVFIDPVTGVPAEPRGAGQSYLEVALEPIADEVRRAAERLKKRGSRQVGEASRNSYVVHSAPVDIGPSVTTRAIWNFYEAGYTTEQILNEYPSLTPWDVRAAIQYEADRR